MRSSRRDTSRSASVEWNSRKASNHSAFEYGIWLIALSLSSLIMMVLAWFW
jgi:hypothetical protein